MNDKELILKMLSKNERDINNAISYLYKNMQNIANNIVINNSGNYDDALDVLQEGIISFYNNLVKEKRIMVQNNLIINKNKDIVKISSYMYSVFRNIWFLKLRKNKNIINVDISDTDMYIDETDVYTEKTEFEKKLGRIKKEIELMGEKCKDILNLFWIKRMKFKEIADKLGHSNAETSKQIKSRCQKELKRRIYAEK